MILSLIIGVLLGAAAVVFAFENTEIVSLTYLGRGFETSVALLVLMAVATGILISILVSLPSAVGSAFRTMGLKRENKKLVNEVEEARREAVAPTIVLSEPESTVVDLRNS